MLIATDHSKHLFSLSSPQPSKLDSFFFLWLVCYSVSV